MIVTYPHMGNLGILAQALLREYRVDFRMPPPVTEETLHLGQQYAPAGVCAPMKRILGNLMQAAELGADTAIFPGGHGPCRFGWFASEMQEILREQSIPMEIFTIELGSRPRQLMQKLRSFAPLHQLAASVPDALAAATQVDALDDKLLFISSTGVTVDESEIWKSLNTAASLGELAHTAKLWNHRLEALQDGEPRLTLGIVGDIFTTNEPDSSLYLQRRLAARGVYTLRSMSISRYLKQGLEKSILPGPFAWERASNPYMERAIGGFARQTVGYAALWARKGIDGIIQLYPMGCMPEIMAQPLLQHLTVPVLTLVMDDLSQTGGYETRVEAFLDMIERRKEGVS